MNFANAPWPVDVERAIDNSSISERAPQDMKWNQGFLDGSEFFVIFSNIITTIMRVPIFLVYFKEKSDLLKAFSIFHLADVRNLFQTHQQN